MIFRIAAIIFFLSVSHCVSVMSMTDLGTPGEMGPAGPMGATGQTHTCCALMPSEEVLRELLENAYLKDLAEKTQIVTWLANTTVKANVFIEVINICLTAYFNHFNWQGCQSFQLPGSLVVAHDEHSIKNILKNNMLQHNIVSLIKSMLKKDQPEVCKEFVKQIRHFQEKIEKQNNASSSSSSSFFSLDEESSQSYEEDEQGSQSYEDLDSSDQSEEPHSRFSLNLHGPVDEDQISAAIGFLSLCSQRTPTAPISDTQNSENSHTGQDSSGSSSSGSVELDDGGSE